MNADARRSKATTVPVTLDSLRSAEREVKADVVVIEEPLEIRVGDDSIAVTMRTPGHDQELAAGFIYTEGVVREPAHINTSANARSRQWRMANIVQVRLDPAVVVDLENAQRNFYATSSCGICGKASIEQVRQRVRPISSDLQIPRALFASLADQMRTAQHVFGETGGLHAAALFGGAGELLCLREDVGRHNAVDKVVGWAVLHRRLPLDGCILLISGRASFEIVQKALVARVPIVAAVSAPSSLAVNLARENQMTLIGFLRGEMMNIYAGAERIV
jgi:FdhD protein